MEETLVCATVVENEAEAEMACGALRAAGIRCMYQQAATAAAWQGSLSGGPFDVLVEEAELARAREVLGEPTER